jgi:signal transduction histidine kinase
MTLPIIAAILSTFTFGILAIYFSMKEEKLKRILKEKEKRYQHKLNETTILEQIQNRIGYSLDTEKVTDVITGSIENLFPYSTSSSLVLKNGKLIFKTTIKEPVSTVFIMRVKEEMLKSLSTLVRVPLPSFIDEKLEGGMLDEGNNSTLSSSFNIPLIVNQKIQGLINISSTKALLYKDEDMKSLYRITNLIGNTLSRLQEMLIREKSKLTSLIGSLEDGVFMVDVNSQITVMNKSAKDFLHLEKPNPSIIDVLSNLPNTYNFGDKIEKAITQNQKIEEENIQHEDKIINITITPVMDSLPYLQPKVIGASFLIHDITLEKSLAKMKEDFTHIIVHELRSPLTSIKASTEMLTTQTNLTGEEKTRLTNIINSQAKKMLDEVSMILDAAKLDSGLFTIQKTKDDIKKLIEETVESFRILAKNKSINLTTHIDPAIPQAEFDNYQIRRVISNLISNSIKFTPESGTVNIRAWSSPQEITVSVVDTGTGIPKDKQHLLFSRFTQIKNANSAAGTGLGLYITKGIIEAHKGTVSLESEPNKGTTLTFTLPLTPPALN